MYTFIKVHTYVNVLIHLCKQSYVCIHIPTANIMGTTIESAVSVSSMIMATAARGACNEVARPATAPTIANEPASGPGQKRTQASPIKLPVMRMMMIFSY
jgi:hypothetical protein